jgi:23S rRNA (cytosine1962-C5)-methyltransferase
MNMEPNAAVILKKGGGRLLKSGGAWIFDNEIASCRGAYINGGLVSVEDFDGYPLGSGFINRNSRIRVRMLTRDPEQEINEAFLKGLLKRAWDYRKKTVDTSSVWGGGRPAGPHCRQI